MMLGVSVIFGLYVLALAMIFLAVWLGWFTPRVVRTAGSEVFLSDGRRLTVPDGKHFAVGMRVRLHR